MSFDIQIIQRSRYFAKARWVNQRVQLKAFEWLLINAKQKAPESVLC